MTCLEPRPLGRYALRTDPGIRREAMSFVMAQYAFPSHRIVFIFTQRVFFRVKRFQPIIRVENNNQKRFTILHVPHIGFLCHLDSEKILLYGSWLESKGFIYILLCEDFVKFDV